VPDSAADFSRDCREFKAAGRPTAAVETPPVDGVVAKTGFVRCVDSLVCRGIRINRRSLEAEVTYIQVRFMQGLEREWPDVGGKSPAKDYEVDVAKLGSRLRPGSSPL
jgi:hypothetical protein